MNKLEEKILNVFLMTENTMMEINDNNCISYLAKGFNSYSIAIPYNLDLEVSQDFVGMKISILYTNYDNNSIRSICLTADHSVDPAKFALVAADFASSDNRRILLTNPYEWVDKWRSIFGDSLKKKMVYDVLGEMVALKYAYEEDKTFVWMGPDAGTHDLVALENIAEVKSTVKKTENIVSINSSYQLSTTKPTKLMFVRLEKKPYCLTINKLIEQLVRLGYPENKLEESLSNLGYKKGDRQRDESFDLLSLYRYEINKENFPLFTVSDINQFAPNNNIIGYTISLDLTSVNHEVLFEKN